MLVFLLMGCPSEPLDTGPTLDTGWFTGPSNPECEERVLRTYPTDGTTDWYWRSPPFLQVGGEDHDAFSGVLRDADGAVVPTTPVWQGNQAVFDLETPLTPDSDYTLRIGDCEGFETLSFHTSHYGAPLTEPPRNLIWRTWVVDLGQSRWESPPGVGPLMNLYFTEPVLLGVEWATNDTIEFIGAQGYRTTTGEVRQLPGQPSWDFPSADFTASPYFEAHADTIDVELDGVRLIVHDFTLSSTISADGRTLGGGWVTGFGDTRYLGPLLNQGSEPNAVCDLTAGLGVTCEACPDGEPYCLRLSARDAVGTLVDGLVVQRQD